MKKFLVLMFLFISTPVFSGSCNNRICSAELKTIYPHEDGNIYIEMDTDQTPLDCTLSQNIYLVLEDTHKLHAEIYALIVASHFANKEISLRIATGSANCRIVYAVSRK